LELTGTIDAATFVQRVNQAPTGALTVRPAVGQSEFVVNGPVVLQRANVAIQNGRFTGLLEFRAEASGSSFSDGKGWQFNIYGADGIRIERSLWDGECRSPNNRIYDYPAGAVPENFVLRDNEFRNYRVCADPSIHNEALFIGYSDGGLIKGNRFENNGSTAHIFFTYWGSAANPSSSWARNICVEGNAFLHVVNGFFAIQSRDEIPSSANIDIDPNTNTFTESPPKLLADGFLRSC
jgi:hypothetical protein